MLLGDFPFRKFLDWFRKKVLFRAFVDSNDFVDDEGLLIHFSLFSVRKDKENYDF